MSSYRETSYYKEIKSIEELWDRLYRVINDKLGLTKKRKFFPSIEKREKLEEELENRVKFGDGSLEDPSPQESLTIFLTTEDMLEISKSLGIPKKIREDRQKDELAILIAERIGFDKPYVPYGLKGMIGAFWEAQNKAIESSDVEIIQGCVVTAFKILERVFKEMLRFYLTWRFGDWGDWEGEAKQTWLSSLIKNKSEKTIKNLKNDRFMLGASSSLFKQIDAYIENSSEERTKMIKSFGRDYLLYPPRGKVALGKFDKLPVSSEDLQKHITVGRNRIVHFVSTGQTKEEIQINVSTAMDEILKFLTNLREEKIFPEVIRQLYCVESWRGTRRITVLTDDNIQENVFTQRDFEPSKEFYFWQSRGIEPIFIERCEKFIEK